MNLKQLKKRIFASTPAMWALGFTVATLLRFIRYTNRVEFRYSPTAMDVAEGRRPGMVSFWHGRLAMQPFTRKSAVPVHAISSGHRDGQFLGYVLRCFNIGPISGSRSKGATRVTLAMIDVVKQGHILAIAPDGPRGPHQKAAPGAAYIAGKCGIPIIPFTFSATRYWRFKSWDHFLLPKPFGRVLIIAGEPIFVPEDASDEAIATATQQLENAMTDITAQADADCGVTA